MEYGREGDKVKSRGTEGHARRFRRIVEPIRGERRGSGRTGRTRRNRSFANGIWTREAKLVSVSGEVQECRARWSSPSQGEIAPYPSRNHNLGLFQNDKK